MASSAETTHRRGSAGFTGRDGTPGFTGRDGTAGFTGWDSSAGFTGGDGSPGFTGKGSSAEFTPPDGTPEFTPQDGPPDPARRRVAARAGSVGVGGTSAEPGETGPSGRSVQRAARVRRARRRNVALAVVTVGGLVVLPLVLWSAFGSGDGTQPAGGASSPGPGKGTPSPGASWAGAHAAGQGPLHGRLHNLASGLCVGVAGNKAVEGAETELAPCGAAPGQQWTYETDGLLRSSAAPQLCLDSQLGYSVRLAPCSATGRAGRNIRYDFTLQGALIPRWNQELALTPAATDGSGALVLKVRAPGDAQRWALDTAKPELQMQNVNWDSGNALSSTATSRRAVPEATPAPSASRTSPQSPSPSPAPTATGSGPAPTPPATADPCSAYPYRCGGDGWGGGGYGGGGWHHR